MTTSAEVVAAVRAVVAEHPAVVYDRAGGLCSFWPDERNPLGCLVGAALDRLGLRDRLDRYWDGCDVATVLDVLGVESVPPEMRWLMQLQWAQDAGTVWRAAVAGDDRAWPVSALPRGGS
jgi:hypothetical protein